MRCIIFLFLIFNFSFSQKLDFNELLDLAQDLDKLDYRLSNIGFEFERSDDNSLTYAFNSDNYKDKEFVQFSMSNDIPTITYCVMNVYSSNNLIEFLKKSDLKLVDSGYKDNSFYQIFKNEKLIIINSKEKKVINGQDINLYYFIIYPNN